MSGTKHKPKRCFVCGEIFFPTNGAQKFCCGECAAQYKAAYVSIYYNKNNAETVNDEYLGDGIFIKEEQLMCKPTLYDKIKSEQIIKDFGIREYIPNFDTLEQLNKWQKTQIHGALQ